MSDLGNKKIFSNNLKMFMKMYDINRSKLCEDLKLNYSTVSEWITGKKYPRIDKIELLSRYFGCLKSDLIEDKNKPQSTESDLTKYGIMPITTKKLPLLGNIACGEPIFADEDRESYIEVGTDINADFCLRAKGDSMINARICDGDIVFIRKQESVLNGEIAAVVIDDSATLKRVYYDRERNILQLVAENTDYAPQVYSGSELEDINILGKAVAFQSDVK